MANAKQEVFKLLETLPEEASLEDIQYHLYVLQCIGRGRQDVEAGRTLPQDAVAVLPDGRVISGVRS
ncbi:MAG TPA: hypothetical protein VJA16_14830 [Thermoanaerobaculia bacterium]